MSDTVSDFLLQRLSDWGIKHIFGFPGDGINGLISAMVGDGAMQTNGINGLITISKYRQRWSKPHRVVTVLKNLDLNQVTSEQRVAR